MELWGEIWNLHRDRPPVFFQVREACATMLRNRHHEDVPPRTLLQAYLTLLEYCGDFQLQSCMLNVILSDGGVRHYYDWFAAAWFAGRPKTCKAFVHLVESKLSCNDFLTIFNNELELQFIFSARCVLVRWQDEPQEHEEQVWLHLNCGTKTLSLTGLQAVPTEFSAQEMFILKSTEIKKVKVLNLESDHGFGKLQGIEIVTSKGQLFVQTDPHILDWTMFSHFVNFIFKVTVEFESYSKKGSNLTDCNGNEPSESKSDFGQSFNFNGNPLEDAILLQPVVQNSVFQVSSSQDALKTLAINSDSNDIEICYHNKQVSHKSLNDSDTADESHDQISVPVDKFLKKDCEEENNAKVNCSLEDTDNCEESQQHDLSDSNIANSQEDSNLLPLHASKLKIPQYADLYVEKTPDTEEDTTVSHLITAVDNDAHVTEMADPKTKSKRGRRKGSNISRKPRMTSPKAKGESHEDSEKSDNELIGTPRRITRRYTLHLKDALGTDCDSQFKAPTELPKSVNRKRLNNRKRKSDDGANFITEVETSTTSAILPHQPATEDTIETSPSKLVRPSSGEESGTFTAADEILQSTSPPKVPHPDSMPTLETPIATPVREPEDSLIQPDFINIHEKLNEELKSDSYKEDTMYVSPGSPPTIPSNMGPSSPPAIPAYLLQGPPPAIPLHANASQRPLVYRNYNMCLPPKHRKYDDDDDFKSDNCDAWEMNAMDSSSDASFLDNAGSAVLLPADDNGFSSTPDTLKVTVPIGDMNNLQQFSEICSHVETTDEHQ